MVPIFISELENVIVDTGLPILRLQIKMTE